MKKKKKSKKVIRPAAPIMGVNLSGVTDDSLPQNLEIHCPTCRTHWGNAYVQFGKPIKKSDFAVRADFKDKFSVQKSGLPICPSCDFQYSPMAMYALMMAATTRKRMEGSWTPQYSRQEDVSPPPEGGGQG